MYKRVVPRKEAPAEPCCLGRRRVDSDTTDQSRPVKASMGHQKCLTSNLTHRSSKKEHIRTKIQIQTTSINLKRISSSRGTFPSNSLATMVSLSPVIGCSPPQPLILPPLRVCSLVANKKSTSTRLHSFSLFWSYPINSLLIASWRLLRPAQTTKKPSRCSTSVAPAEFNLNRSAISCEHADKTLHWLKFAISRRALAEIVCERAL